ncbi:MAG: hypothetical protein V2B18_03925 [Pseudomonadota bacterium]
MHAVLLMPLGRLSVPYARSLYGTWSGARLRGPKPQTRKVSISQTATLLEDLL